MERKKYTSWKETAEKMELGTVLTLKSVEAIALKRALKRIGKKAVQSSVGVNSLMVRLICTGVKEVKQKPMKNARSMKKWKGGRK